eukprot:gene17183-22701_t
MGVPRFFRWFQERVNIRLYHLSEKID